MNAEYSADYGENYYCRLFWESHAELTLEVL